MATLYEEKSILEKRRQNLLLWRQKLSPKKNDHSKNDGLLRSFFGPCHGWLKLLLDDKGARVYNMRAVNPAWINGLVGL